MVKAQGGKATIANVSKEGSMERVTMKFITDATGMEIQQISFDKVPRATARFWVARSTRCSNSRAMCASSLMPTTSSRS